MATASSFPGEIQEDVTCRICLELFTRPKVLPCQHTFCQDCLQGVAGEEETFQCPICRYEVVVPFEGVAGLPDNRMARDLCEKLRNLHFVPILSQETRQRPQWKQGNRCSFHPSKEVKLYCKRCDLPVCSVCLEEGHDEHPTTGLKKAAQEKKSIVRALIHEGQNIKESYSSFITQLGEQQQTLEEQKQQRDNSIIEACNQTKRIMDQKVEERKDQLLTESQQHHSESLANIDQERGRVSADVNELSAACDRAEQELQLKGIVFLSQQTTLTGVVGKYRGKAPTPVQTQPAVFQPTDTPVPVLGHVMVQSLPSAPTPAAPVSSSDAERGASHHHGIQEQGEHQFQRVTFGRQGSGPGQLEKPHGVTVSNEGEIFVADENQRIQVFTLQGTFVREFPTVVSGGQKMEAFDVAMDREGNLWVVGCVWVGSSANFAVRYNKQGRVLRKFDLQNTGWDRGVAVDTRMTHLLITQTKEDSCNRHGKVKRFRPDGTRVREKKLNLKKFLASVRVSSHSRQQGMTYPRYINVNRAGNILVSDWDTCCVYVYNEDRKFLFQFGGEGSGEGQLKYPRGICTDWEGNIIVADTGNNRVEMFDYTGTFIKHITTDMTLPCAVAIAPQGQLIVTEQREHTVTIFQNY